MRYTLDKSSKKFICPDCKQKRLVRFIDQESNTYLDESFGRCDRETSCGYFKKPNYPDASYKTITPIINKPTGYHDFKTLNSTLKSYQENNFFKYLCGLFPLGEIQNIFSLYRIGTAKIWNGATVFWQIDDLARIRAGKILLFDQNTGKRVKKPRPLITWAHSKLGFTDFNLKQCLFGLHLKQPNKTIALVESEKTAIIMSLFLPEYIWMATGSKQNFKIDLLLPLKNNEIISFPDKGEIKDWQNKADDLNRFGFKIRVSDYVEKNQDYETGTDLADIYIDLKSKKTNLQDLSPDKRNILSLAKNNNNLLLLIKTFDLLDSSDNPIDLRKLELGI